jgi:RNA polymerase sigma-70 factor (ECF subfamily)
MLGVNAEDRVGAEQRFRALYLAHYRQVYMYFRRRTDIEYARDGTADTFLVAWRRLDDVPDGDRTLPWLYGTARRVLANQWRSRRRSDRLREKLTGIGGAMEPGPEARVVPSAEAQSVLDAMNRLRTSDREIIRLAEWEGLSHGEIAAALGCRTHAVDQRMSRARRRLAAELGLDRASSARPAEGVHRE